MRVTAPPRRRPLRARSNGPLHLLPLPGKVLPLDVEPCELVEDIKGKIALSDWNVPPCQQRLLLAGRQLVDEATLTDCGVHKEATLHLMLRLRGGTEYLCGDCGHKNEIKPKDPIRCRFCGYRILYKMRTKNRNAATPPSLGTPFADPHPFHTTPASVERRPIHRSCRLDRCRSHVLCACSHPIRGEVTASTPEDPFQTHCLPAVGPDGEAGSWRWRRDGDGGLLASLLRTRAHEEGQPRCMTCDRAVAPRRFHRDPSLRQSPTALVSEPECTNGVR